MSLYMGTKCITTLEQDTDTPSGAQSHAPAPNTIVRTCTGGTLEGQSMFGGRHKSRVQQELAPRTLHGTVDTRHVGKHETVEVRQPSTY